MTCNLYSYFLNRYFAYFKGRVCCVPTLCESSFKLFVSSIHEHMRYQTVNTKEPEMLDWLKNCRNLYGSDDFCFFDIGANVGLYSLYLASYNKNCSIYAFEPESSNYYSLNKNVSINCFTNIKPLLCGLSSTDSFLDLHVSILESGAGASSLGSDYRHTDNSKYNIHKQPVLSLRLDSTLDYSYFKFPNFIKIDVDGHEDLIIDGGSRVLSDPRLLSIIMEFEYKSTSEEALFIDKITSFGFALDSKSSWIDKGLVAGVNIQNYIFNRV